MILLYPKLKIVNIKLSLYTNNPINLNINKKMEVINIYNSSIKITIYKHSPKLINITGIKSFKELNKLKSLIKDIFDVKIRKQRIDSIMLNYKSKTNMKINLNKLYNICKEIINFYKDYTLDYNCELFNAPFLKSTSGKGTILLFSNGSVQIMGCKKQSYIKDNKLLVNLIYSFYIIQKCNNENKFFIN